MLCESDGLPLMQVASFAETQCDVNELANVFVEVYFLSE